MSGLVRALACLSLLSSAGCLLFADPINTAPTVSLGCTQEAVRCPSAGEPPALVRGKNIQFQAIAADPDQTADTLRFDWYVDTSCAVVLDGHPQVSNTGLVLFSFRPTDLGSRCVAVVVTDSRGASATTLQSFTVVDQSPTAAIAVVPAAGVAQPEPGRPLELPLYSKVTLTGEQSTDPDDPFDQLDFQWSVLSGSTPIPMPGCPDPAKARHLCAFATDVAGNYRVRLVVSARQLVSDPVEQTIQVASDQLPSIVLHLVQPTAPSSPSDPPSQLLASVDNTFTVNRVEDDGDPYPSSDPSSPYPTPPAGFVWLYQSGSDPAFHRLSRETGPSFTIPARTFLPQESVRLRVEYHDRVTACQPRTALCNTVFATCDPATPICYSPDLRVQWVTWSVVFR